MSHHSTTRFSKDPAGARPSASRVNLTRLGSTLGTGARDSTARPFLYRAMGTSLGTTYFLEKQAVVIDFGRAHTKVGFATESRPRHIIATPELRARRRPSPQLSCSISTEEWIDILDKLLSKIFFHYLSVSPKDRRVVICDSPYSPVNFRSAVAFVLFKRFSIPSVAWVTDLVLPLYLTGLNSGIVIDVGYESSRILGTFAGIPILSAYGATACSGRLINARLHKRLLQDLSANSQAVDWLEDEQLVEDFKARTCYVACNMPREGGAWTMQTGQGATYPLQQREVVRVAGESRWRPCELLFEGLPDDGSSSQAERRVDPMLDNREVTLQEMRRGLADQQLSESQLLAHWNNLNPAQDPDEDSCEGIAPSNGGDWSPGNLSVPDMFSEVLRKCPIDVRALLLQNVVVVGGCAMLRGLLPRLAMELRTKLQKDIDTAKIADRLRLTPLDFAPVCGVWTGGAVFGAIEGTSDYTSEDYDQGKPLPDWAREGFV